MKKNTGTMTSQAYDAIKRMILDFELVPGQTVSDFNLSGQLGISRTPVRDAIKTLIKDGLVIITDNDTIVAPVNKEDLIDLCSMREALEAMAVRLIVQGKILTKEDIAHLRFLNNEILKKNVPTQIHLTFDPDEEIHNFIMEKSGKRRLKEQFQIIQLQMRRYRYLTLIDEQRTALTFKEHEAIIDSLEKGELTASEEAMRSHLHITVERYVSAMERVAVSDWVNIIRNINSIRP